jgi:hypothetical protein
VPGDELPSDADVDKVNSSLGEGLEICRSMIANYRTLLSGEQTEGNEIESDEPPETDSD